ncbi:phage tail protein [Phenylobacterium sp.]|uniref:phage tail protein n=1 Tax=Phenylobacterium sp. TaxID=1871053 RepID=UPI00301D65FC
MIKPDHLRRYLEAGHDWVAANKDRVLVRVEQGRAVAGYGPGLSFEWRYTVKLVFLDFDGDRAELFALVFAWLGRHQRELLANPATAEDGVRFEADILDSRKADLELTIPLTEGVVGEAAVGGAGFDLAPRPEHPEELDLAPPGLLHQLYANTERLMQCQAHPEPPPEGPGEDPEEDDGGP